MFSLVGDVRGLGPLPHLLAVTVQELVAYSVTRLVYTGTSMFKSHLLHERTGSQLHTLESVLRILRL